VSDTSDKGENMTIDPKEPPTTEPIAEATTPADLEPVEAVAVEPVGSPTFGKPRTVGRPGTVAADEGGKPIRVDGKPLHVGRDR
jgi:hypothetical protein